MALGEKNPIRVMAPATTANLGPGFDCLGMALDLWNLLEVRQASEANKATDGQPLVEVIGEGTDELATDETNLVYQSMEFLFCEADQEMPPLRLRCRNQIPLKRGLGSSAAAIAGGLVAANALCTHPFSANDLYQRLVIGGLLGLPNFQQVPKVQGHSQTIKTRP